jgi:hypothetical protein
LDRFWGTVRILYGGGLWELALQCRCHDGRRAGRGWAGSGARVLPALKYVPVPAGPVVVIPWDSLSACPVPALQQQPVSHHLLIMQSD